jgi:hypothetical protein
MSCPSDPKKLAVWRERFERLPRSGLTVAQFCARERVSVASFYHWRKKLGQAALRRRVPARRGIFRQVAVVPVPSSVVPAAPGVAPAPAASRVSIQLPCGTRIEVHVEHLDAVRAVVGEVARAGRGLEAGTGHDLQAGAAPC